MIISRDERRKFRVRKKIKKSGLPRLSVHRSVKFTYAQVIDDKAGRTLASASSLSLAGDGTKSERAHEVGRLLAERAISAGVAAVVFDRGKFAFHGRVKAIADGAREGGLKF